MTLRLICYLQPIFIIYPTGHFVKIFQENFNVFQLVNIYKIWYAVIGREHIILKGGEGLEKRKIKIVVALAGIIYLSVVLYWVLFDGGFGRAGLQNLGDISLNAYREHFSETGNLVPFRTVKLFFDGFFLHHTVSFKAFAVNIFGNVLVFVPFGVFLPVLFKRQNKFWVFLLTMTAFVFCIEALQLLLLTGSPDIDDIILNVLGGALGYACVRMRNGER